MAELRQATLSAKALVLYTEELAEWELSDLLPVIREFSLKTRKKGETAFPPLADIVERLRAGEISKRGENESRAQQEQWERDFVAHIRWKQELTGQTAQEVLDAVRQPGYTGRTATPEMQLNPDQRRAGGGRNLQRRHCPDRVVKQTFASTK
jgi:hypothetical protein